MTGDPGRLPVSPGLRCTRPRRTGRPLSAVFRPHLPPPWMRLTSLVVPRRPGRLVPDGEVCRHVPRCSKITNMKWQTRAECILARRWRNGGPDISSELALSSVAFLHGAACSDCGCAGAGGSGRLVIHRSRRKTRSQVWVLSRRTGGEQDEGGGQRDDDDVCCGQGFPSAGCGYAVSPSLPRMSASAPSTRRAAAMRAGAGWLVSAFWVDVGIRPHLGPGPLPVSRVRRGSG